MRPTSGYKPKACHLPGEDYEGVDSHVARQYVSVVLGAAVHGAYYPLAGPHEESRRSVQVFHPSWNWVLPGPRHWQKQISSFQ